MNITKTLLTIATLITLASFLVVQKKKIVFFGDSITEAGAKPGGYILKIGDLAAAEKMADQFELIGAGIGGNKVYDLYLRMPSDVIAQSPDIVVIYVGVNDVWHKTTYGTGTDADKFEKFYRAIIKELQLNNIKVMLVTPAVIGEKNDYSNQQDGDLNKYSQIIRNIAKDLNLPLCDLHSIFHIYEVDHNAANADKGILTTDGVHLNDPGNKLVAEEIWKVLKTVQ